MFSGIREALPDITTQAGLILSSCSSLKSGFLLRASLLLLLILLFALPVLAQRPGTPALPGAATTVSNAPQLDTTNRKNTPDWHKTSIQVTYRSLHNAERLLPDSSIRFLHHRLFLEDWAADLGNQGSPVQELLFRPESYGQTGIRLGYPAFDRYRLQPDSLLFYQTTNPYSVFTYQLGSKLEQVASILHTQNIHPRWNFAAQYRKTTSPGFYKIQRVNQDNASLNTHYTSRNQRYELFAAAVYNKEQQDENGGIAADSFLSSDGYSDRMTIPVNFQNDAYSARRSSVTNMLRDWQVLLQHGYTWGRIDTTYNEDSTRYEALLLPRFRIAHRMSGGQEKHVFRHMRADSAAWASFFSDGLSAGDSVQSTQAQGWIDNYVSLNGFIGKRRELLLTAGAGNRLDLLYTDYVSGREKNTVVSNYVQGLLEKNADSAGQWLYEATVKFYVTGAAAGNFYLQGKAGRKLRHFGELRVVFRQDLRQAPYDLSLFRNAFYEARQDLNKESITMAGGDAQIDRWGLNLGLRHYLLNNYTYLTAPGEIVTNGRLDVRQSGAFNLTQISLYKLFRFGKFRLDNELVYQQTGGNAPLNVPQFLGRHQLWLEGPLFSQNLQIATGVQVAYQNNYAPAGYAPFYNRYYYQNETEISNKPELNVFFNFRVKRFRASISGDQLQALWWQPNIAAPGYPKQNAMLRFGFSWVLIN